MQTQVTFRHFKSQHPELHSTAEEIAASFQKYNDGIISTNVEFINDNDKIVNFVVHLQGATLAATEATEDFHKSLNLASEKMIRQIQKHKTKNAVK
jgi:ribosomal subunit interface protein